ncbi:DUF4383 domain-containing protein [Mycolicibacterium sp. F2034L]|uniref:DUF4383 domain-containing protein n=1 Tax=Mycolicibacterium sp. F2034L TaxID=2926422 RepID=UPI001FF51439|nr:DUF4383 domain-containing protein [Mycolicibacterium sp. F2034L]MCK0172883.1 DUF4383 domain-containing protein [Mycolicibacterium sp. F2034L]
MARKPTLMAVQGAALLVGAGFLLLGAFGFVPGLTVNQDALRWVGHPSDADAELFGVFAVSGLHNVVHLVYGAAGMLSARTYAASRAYLLIGGFVLLGVWIFRMATAHSAIAELFPLNRADSWLHFALGVIMVILALTLAAQRDPTKPRRRKRRTASHA